MTEKSYPFDAAGAAGTGGTAQVLENEWQAMARLWLTTGVVDLPKGGRAGGLQVTANGGAMQVTLAAGTAWVEGFLYDNDAALALVIGAADATNPRVDTVVVRLDRAANNAQVFVKQGVAAASPAAPALTQTDALYELPLANVTVPAAAGVIVAGNVADRRATVQGVRGATLLANGIGRIADVPLTLRGADGQVSSLLRAENNLGTAVAQITQTGRVHGTYMAAGALVFGDDVTLGVVVDAGTKQGVVVRAHAAQAFPMLLVQNDTGGSILNVTPKAEMTLDRRFGMGAADAAGILSIIRKDADTGDFITGSTATTGVLFRVTSAGALQVAQSVLITPAPGVLNTVAFQGFNNPEAISLQLGRPSNSPPRIAANDVNKTLEMRISGAAGAAGLVLRVGGTSSAPEVNSGSALNALSLQVLSGPNGNGSAATAVVRLMGLGVAHGDLSWNPGTTEGFRFTESGSTFSQTAYSGVGVGALFYNSLTARSTEASKRDVQTLDVAAAPRTKLQQGAAGAAGAAGDPIAKRLRRLRPVSFRYKQDNPARHPLRHGFVAEELAAALPEVAVYDNGGATPGTEDEDGQVQQAPVDAASGAVMGYDLGALVTMTVATLQIVLDRLDALEGRVPQPSPAPART